MADLSALRGSIPAELLAQLEALAAGPEGSGQIADGAVTAAKLAAGAAAANLGNGAVTAAKLAGGAAASNIGSTVEQMLAKGRYQGSSPLRIQSLPAYDYLRIILRVRSYGIADTVSLRFNNDSGNNYTHRWITIAQGGTTLVEDSAASASLIELAGEDVTTGRVVEVLVSNLAGKEKICKITTATGTGSAATLPPLEFGAGAWVNTAVQINEVDLLTANGNFVDTDYVIYGGMVS